MLTKDIFLSVVDDLHILIVNFLQVFDNYSAWFSYLI